MNIKFYKCELCGNVAELVFDGKGALECCGKPMVLLEAGTTDAAVEKHVPAISRDGNTVTVKVGEVEHPMLPEHFITSIWVVQDNHVQRAELNHTNKPEFTFQVSDGPVTAYEYCNLHGLWKSEI